MRILVPDRRLLAAVLVAVFLVALALMAPDPGKALKAVPGKVAAAGDRLFGGPQTDTRPYWRQDWRSPGFPKPWHA